MFSYIFMKILESRPERYDTGINFLSGGHAEKIRRRIVKDFVRPGTKLLDIGCGTGLLIEEAVKSGAEATGIDISAEMLKIAQKKIDSNNFKDKTSVYNAGVSEIGTLFEPGSFDLIVSTLVFSEFYSEERSLALRQIKRLLKPGGKLVIAVEVEPRKILQRVGHFLIRLPLSIITYTIAQTGTRPVKHLPEEVKAAGFSIRTREYAFLDSFIILSAEKKSSAENETVNIPPAKIPSEDVSAVKSLWDFIGRWFPNPVEPGLRAIGNPDRNSPVVLTSNFHLTVRRVEKSLKNENIFILVAPSNGINVWCASVGGELNTHSVIAAIRTSRLKDRVNHRKILLPQFSAPGVDLKLLKEETGWKGIFGPAYSKDIPEYFENHKSVLKNNRADFSFWRRMEMLLSMNFVIWAAIIIISALIAPQLTVTVSAYFWAAAVLLYAGFPIIPGKSGWLKAAILSTLTSMAIGLYGHYYLGHGYSKYWELMLGFTAINLALGFDLKGIVAGYPSEAEWLLKKIGMNSFGHIFSADKKMEGLIHQDIEKCNNCRSCILVCPKGVFEEAGKDIRIGHREECFACTACIMQCNEKALRLN